ncbi:MAG: sulfotransferase [Anaerolineae bacterium]|nr:sulfotransferase [Anaerolineae bacterium]
MKNLVLKNGYTFNTFANWKRVLCTYPYVQPKYIPKLMLLAGTGTLASPFQWYERRRYGEMLQEIQPHDEPIFIMGFWRTGTTHLHNLLTQDSNYGYVSTLHSFTPGFIVSNGKVLRRFMQSILPKIRPMDNVAPSPDAPQEEDIALMNISPHAYYHYLLFPKEIRPLFEKYVLMHDISSSELEEWREDYLYILRTATYLSGGKPLVLKNPSHIAHLPQILGLFPKARFIEIRRDPLSVWISFLHLHKSTIPTHNLQDFSWEIFEKDALYIFEETMKKWLKERNFIPKENNVTVYYEDLISSPLKTLHHIYESFGLSSEDIASRWEGYLKSIKGYQRNQLVPKPEDIQTIRERLGFLYEAWGYSLPVGSQF